jgi:hypothetical protein
LLVLGLIAAIDRARPPRRAPTSARRSPPGRRGARARCRDRGAEGGDERGHRADPGTLAALAGLVPIWWLVGRGPLGTQARRALEARPRLRRALPAAGCGAIAALVFNDSGVVAALLLLAPPTGAVVDGMLCDSLR